MISAANVGPAVSDNVHEIATGGFVGARFTDEAYGGCRWFGWVPGCGAR